MWSRKMFRHNEDAERETVWGARDNKQKANGQQDNKILKKGEPGYIAG